jgi:hypothetical protein
MHTGFQWGNPKERDHLEDKGTDRIILKWILKKDGGTVCTGFIWLRRGASEGCFKHGNENFNCCTVHLEITKVLHSPTDALFI